MAEWHPLNGTSEDTPWKKVFVDHDFFELVGSKCKDMCSYEKQGGEKSTRRRGATSPEMSAEPHTVPDADSFCSESLEGACPGKHTLWGAGPAAI